MTYRFVSSALSLVRALSLLAAAPLDAQVSGATMTGTVKVHRAPLYQMRKFRSRTCQPVKLGL